MKKILSLSFVFIFCLSILLNSCVDGEKPDESDTLSKEESMDGSLVPHLGEADYKGKTIRFLTTWDHIPYSVSQISPEETTTEPVNDAFIRRNEALEDEYGFKIEAIFGPGWDDFYLKVRQDVAANAIGDEYDVLSTGAFYLAPLAIDGSLRDLYREDDSHLRLDKDWWDLSVNEYLTIDNSLYFTTGDIFVLDDEATIATYFNKDIIKELELDNPYDLVYSGDWTLDNMYKMVKAAAREDGDGAMTVTDNDRWGLVGPVNMIYQFIIGARCPIVEKDKDDLPFLAMGNKRNVDAFMDIHEMITDKDNVAYIERYYAWNDPNAGTVVANFHRGNALFYADAINALAKEGMRESDVNYGIVPMPKFNSEQDDYGSTIESYTFFCLAIPDQIEDIDFVTFALEAMAYTGQKIVTPEYYQRTLKLKRFDDSDASNMLDIIFSNRVIDLAILFNWDNSIQYYNRTALQPSAQISSFIESIEGKFNSAMHATIESFEANK